MHFDDLDKKIIHCISLRAEQPVTQIARSLKLDVHIVRYRIRRLIDDGEIIFRPLINVRSLGYYLYTFFLAPTLRRGKSKEELYKRLGTSPYVTWLCSLEGDFPLGVTLCLEDPIKLLSVLGQLFESNNISIGYRGVSQFLRLTHFSSFGSPRLPKQHKTVQASEFSGGIHCDQLDHCLLSALSDTRELNVGDLAKRCDCSPATARARIHKLEKSGVLIAYMFLPNKGIEHYLILVRERSFSSELENRLTSLANVHPAFSWYVRLFGHWDHELGIQLDNDSQDIMDIVDQVCFIFSDKLDDLRLLRVAECRKSLHYPLGVHKSIGSFSASNAK